MPSALLCPPKGHRGRSVARTQPHTASAHLRPDRPFCRLPTPGHAISARRWPRRCMRCPGTRCVCPPLCACSSAGLRPTPASQSSAAQLFRPPRLRCHCERHLRRCGYGPVTSWCHPNRVLLVLRPPAIVPAVLADTPAAAWGERQRPPGNGVVSCVRRFGQHGGTTSAARGRRPGDGTSAAPDAGPGQRAQSEIAATPCARVGRRRHVLVRRERRA